MTDNRRTDNHARWSRNRIPNHSPRQDRCPAAERRAPGKPPKPKESWRDTIESIVFAFILAFLFRTFEAEAFVIPTGSMAPTLYGRHKE